MVGWFIAGILFGSAITFAVWVIMSITRGEDDE